MDEQPTCGRGLAENSVLPKKLGKLIASMTIVLELHMKALDLKDPHAKQEYDAYLNLAKEHHKIADLLNAVANEMAGYRDLPMGRHDMKAMSGPKIFQAFESFVKQKQELMALLQKMSERDQQLLNEMQK